MSANQKQPVPEHARIEQKLVADMRTGILLPGAQLPSAEQLVERFNVSTSTIRVVIHNLLKRGLLEVRGGRKIFVVQPKITQELIGLTGFVEDMEAFGMQATARVIDKKIVSADEVVSRQLQLRKNDPVVRIQRVRIGDGLPLSFDETFLLRSVGEKIMNDDLVTTQIFTLLEEKYNIPLIDAEYNMEAISPPRVVAAALEIKMSSPVFMIERTSYTTHRRPVDYEKLYYRADQIRFATYLQRHVSDER